MSKLYYDIHLAEEFDQPNQPYQEIHTNIPHYQQIKDWLPGEWDKCEIHKTFDGILKDKVKSCTMKCRQETQGNETMSYARITIEFVPGFRLNQTRRTACWEQLDGQMTDGFGESYDRHEIPNANGWQLQL